MKRRSIVIGAVAALALGAYVAAMRDSPRSPSAPDPRAQSPAVPDESFAPQVRREKPIEHGGPTEIASPTTTELGLTVMPSGALMIEGATRSVVEELSAVADVSELYEIKDHLQQTLPRPAGERAADLVQRYYDYRIALEERVDHDEMAEIPQDARIALDALKALRTEFFGAELTELWFGEEDAIGREMIAQAERFR